MEKTIKNRKVSETQLYLTVLFVTCILISNIITAKQIQLPFGITMTASLFVFPITYILSDLFSEVYGYRWSRITCYVGFAVNLFMVLIFQLAIATPSPEFWQNQDAFRDVLGNTPKVFFASMLAFVAGDFINDKVFCRMKARHHDSLDGFGWRAIISSLCGEMMDSMIFLPIVFWGEMPTDEIISLILVEVSIKTGYEVVILPITRIAVKALTAHEEKQNK